MQHGDEDGLDRVEREIQHAEGEVKVAISALHEEEKALENAELEIEELEKKPIHIIVDGEPEETKHRVRTPDQIIREFGGGKDPKTHYLVQTTGGHIISYKDNPHEKIELHDGMSFQIISTGPTPVSDGRTKTGTAAFAAGLRESGFEPAGVEGRLDHLMINYTVPVGRFAGRKIRLGFIVPSDFPLTAPSGPHVSPNIHPIQAGGSHPTGGVHTEQAKAFKSNDADEWQYWSRPFSEWGTSKRTVAAYLGFVYRLWETQ